MIRGDAARLPLPDGVIDCLVTDPPYGYNFMNKDWDKVVVSVDIMKECLRVLKPGAFAFVMSSPRQDVLSRMICNLHDAGFETGFSSIYWTYASGFPKAGNVSKLVDKRKDRDPIIDKSIAIYLKLKRIEKGISKEQINNALGTVAAYTHYEATDNNNNQIPTKQHYLLLKSILDLDDRFDPLIEREEAERNKIPSTGNLHKNDLTHGWSTMPKKEEYLMSDNISITEQAKSLDGSYAGFQPKPAVEVVLVVMKPLSEKSYVDQALSNRKGITWLDDCRIPYQNMTEEPGYRPNYNKYDVKSQIFKGFSGDEKTLAQRGVDKYDQKGRFPANLLVSSDVLNDGKITNSDGHWNKNKNVFFMNKHDNITQDDHRTKDSGSFSRYFDLDKWFSTTFPFLIIPKASKRERNMGLIDSYFEEKKVNDGRATPIDNPFQRGETPRLNTHATVKPVKLMSYLIMLGSRENDLVLDPFAGSGTTGITARLLARRFVGLEINKEYCAIAKARLSSDVLKFKAHLIQNPLI